MQKILVTGGCGYIGSHTIVDLLNHGYEVISIDDNSRSSSYSIAGIEQITGKKIKNYLVDLRRNTGRVSREYRYCWYYSFCSL